MQIVLQGSPSEDEAAAILAAIASVLEEADTESSPHNVRSLWRVAALLEAQGLPAGRAGDVATWGRINRTLRLRRWSKGIV